MTVEHASRSKRGYGYLVGYPSYAVTFFVKLGADDDKRVAAGQQAWKPDEV